MPYTSKNELAMRYYPCVSPCTAVRNLRLTLAQTPGLMQALEAAGYSKKQKLLTPRQVEIIEQHLGVP